MQILARPGLDSSNKLTPYLSPLAVVALSFGLAVGWGSFVLPGTKFLPDAGPLGTALGIGIGALAMGLFALNYHRLNLREPGPGGAFTFARRMFGDDHAFIVGWFLFLAYIAILWANATALVLLVRHTLGPVLQFGFHYTLAGYDIYLGEALLSVAAIALAAALCIGSKRLAAHVQTFLALVFAGGVAVVFAFALAHHAGGTATLAPLFSGHDTPPVVQVMGVLAMMPWAFVGFEAVSHSSAEFHFADKKLLVLLLAAIGISAAVYLMLALLPALAIPEGFATWPDYLKARPGLKGVMAISTFAAAQKAMGATGVALLSATMVAAMFTGLVGTLVATSRLMHAMAEDDILPRRLGALDAHGVPRNAILFVAGLSVLVPFFGRSVLSWPVDVSSIGAAIAYGYTSAAAYKAFGSTGAGKIFVSKLAGAAGVVLSVFFCFLLLVPNYLSGSSMAAESYLVLALWCIFGVLHYRSVFRRDTHSRFGKSSVAWAAMIVLILFSSIMWGRQAMLENALEVLTYVAAEANVDIARYGHHLDHAKALSLVDSLVELILLVVSIAVMLSLYAILHRRERDMSVAKAKAEEVNRAKSFFFSSVSHDIRTPLNAIIGFSQMLKGGFKTAEETNEAIDSILVSSKTLLNLINDVLDFSKLESGRMEILPEPTDCRPLVEELVKSFKIANKTPGVEIRSRIGEMPPLMLDPQRIRQIVFNLVGNAAKFTKSGFIEVRATFTRNEGTASGAFCLEVEDSGPGISAEDQQKIAQPYAQFGNKLSRSKGTGLGLAICRQLATAMGGRLALQSELGRGSTFSIFLPDVQIAAAAPAPAEPAHAPSAAETAPHVIRRTLIVDDQKMNLMILKAMLTRLGTFEIVMATNGREALDILNRPDEPPFDLVLTDMWMPQLDGEGLVRAIRAIPRLAALPVYVLTADIEAQKTCVEVGFTGLLLKPVTLDGLKTIVG